MKRERTAQAAFRLPVSLVRRLDLYAERLRLESPGRKATRADAVRLLLLRVLPSEGVKA